MRFSLKNDNLRLKNESLEISRNSAYIYASKNPFLAGIFVPDNCRFSLIGYTYAFNLFFPIVERQEFMNCKIDTFQTRI